MTSARSPLDSVSGVATTPATQSGTPARSPAGDKPRRDVLKGRPEFELLFRARSERLRQLPLLILRALRLVWAAGRREYVTITLLQVLQGIGVTAQLLVGQRVLRQLLATGDAGMGFRPVLPGLSLLIAITVLLGFAATVIVEQNRVLGELVGRAAFNRVLDIAETIDLEAYEHPAFFDRLQRAQMSGLTRPMQLANGLGTLTTSLAVLAGIAVALSAIEPLLIPFLLLCYIPLWYASTRNSKTLFELVLSLTEDDRQRAYLQQVLSGRNEAKEIRAFALAPLLRRRYDQLYDIRIANLRELARKRMARSLLAAFGTSGLTTAALGLLGYLYVSGRMELAAMGAAVAGLLQVSGRMRSVADGAGALYESALFVDDYEAFVNLAPPVVEDGPAPDPLPGFDQLVADRLSFAYPGADRRAVDGVSLTIGRGEVVALVGENGSGKTTLAKLLAHLYDCDEGRILWDGQDTSAEDPARVRGSIAVIFQDFVRYLLSARDNIAAGRYERSDDIDGIIAAARSSGADAFLTKLPDGYDTILGKEFTGGSDLSLGQWQRVALARAFFRDAPFIILDEPTASLDPRAEYQLFQSIRSLFQGRAVLLISHRFSSVRSADRIYVLEHGRVTEHGNHDELMGNGGLYAELFTLQAAAYLGHEAVGAHNQEPAITAEVPVAEATISLRDDAVSWRRVGEEVVALDIDRSDCLALNHTGALLWSSLAEGATRTELVSLLAERFNVGCDDAASDVDAFLHQLAGRGLLATAPPSRP